MEAFVEAVNEAYHQFDSERVLLERSLDMTSEELVAHNQRLREELEAGRVMQQKLEAELRERKRAEESLRRNMVRLDEAQRLSGAGYWEWNVRTGDAVWSSEMYRIFGYEPGSITPNHHLFITHCHPEDVRPLTEYMRSIRTGRSQPTEFRIRRADDGGVRTLRASARIAADTAGRLSEAFGVCLDITEQRTYEHTLIAAREQAEAATRHAEELLLLKTTLLNNVSHELRTPLAAIIGFADILMADLDGERREFAQLIAQSGERLLDTFNSVLTLASLESGQEQLTLRPCELATEAEEAVQLLQPQARERRLFLTLDVEEAVRVRADSSALHRIFQNLLGNALKFTPQGGITVRVGRHVEPGGRFCGVVSIHDTGRGINPVFLPHLFDAFQQESKGMTRSHEGAGLGLTIVRRLTEMMGGRVEVESTLGVGSTFRVYLPLAGAPHLSLVGK